MGKYASKTNEKHPHQNGKIQTVVGARGQITGCNLVKVGSRVL